MRSSTLPPKKSVNIFDKRSAFLGFMIVLCFTATGARAASSCEIMLDGASGSLPARQARALSNTVDFISDKLALPKFTVREANDDGTSANIWENRLAIERTASDGVVAHEVGHLLFIQLLRERAPNAYAALAKENARIVKDRRRAADVQAPAWNAEVDALINAYAEHFCDLLGILVTGKSSIFADSSWAFLQTERDWIRPQTYPWDSAKGEENFTRTRAMEYRRMGEFRSLIWNDYRELLQGSKKQRRKVLRAVGRAMAEEIEATYDNRELTDRERNRRLTARIEKRLKKID